MIKGLLGTFLELLFPEEGICFLCDEYLEDMKEGHICWECREKLEFIGKIKCSICGKSLELGYLPDKCPECINENHYYTKAFAPLEYSGIIKEAIYKYKYGKKPYMYKVFGDLLVETIENENLINQIDLIVPIPLHRSKMSDRGFNQSELLGKYISKHYNIPIDTRNLIRTKKTFIQNKLSKKERKSNVKNAFKVTKTEVFKDKTILLVDDIYTTGATVNECSRVLVKAGASAVLVLTIARGVDKIKVF
jgi:ComF family protein